MNLQPLGDRLIVEVLEEEATTASGIVLPDTAQEKPQRGKVLEVGPGPRDEDGNRIKMDVEKGDEVIFSKYGKQASEDAEFIIKLGRALGVILILATQRPDKDSLPTGVSANVGIRGQL